MFKKTKNTLAMTLSMAMVASIVTIPGVASAATAKQLSGQDRYETALKIVQDGWTASTSAVITTGEVMADALAAAPLAYAKGQSPILLTKTNSIPAGVLAELKTLGVKNVYIVGGVGAVSKAVADELAAAGLTITRIQGKDRFETSLEVAKAAFGTTPAEVVIANGISYADALSVSSIAAKKGMPILLVNNSILSAEQKSYIGNKTVYAVGGTGVLNAAVVTATNATRLGGLDRYDTNAAILTQFKPDYSKIYLAKGTQANLVDALAGSVLAAKTNSPVVLVNENNAISASLATVVKANITDASTTVLLGGTVTQAAASAVEALKAPVATDLQVKSVSAINAKEFQIVFNKPVDDTTFAGVTFAAQGSATAPGTLTYVLSADEMTLTVRTASTLSQKGYYFASIVGVKDTDGNTLNPYTSVLYLNDTVAPSIASTDGTTSSSSTRTFKLKFNEPSLVDLVKVGSVVVSAVPDASFKTYTVTLPASADALTAGSSYAVTVNGLRDFAGNYASTSTVTTSVAIIQDIVKPVATITAVSPVELKVVFSKDMSATIPVDGITIKDASGNVLPLSGIPTLDSDKRTLHVRLFVSPIATDETDADLSITVKNFSDSIGNIIDSKTTDITVVNDLVKPAMKSVRINPSDNTKVEVSLTESVTGLATSDFVITRNGDTSSTPLTISSISGLDSNNKVVLTLASGLSTSDTYTVALKINSVIDASGNKNDAQVSTFTYSGSAASQITANITATTDGTIAVDSTSAKRKVYIAFSAGDIVNGISNTTGNYKEGSASNPANYTLDGSALPTGTVVTFNDGVGAAVDSVTLDLSAVTSTNLPSEFKNGGNAVVTISSVKNVAGSTIQYTSNQIAVLDKTAPTMSSAYLTGNATDGYTLTLAMSEKIAATMKGDFVLSTVDAVGAPVLITLDTAVLGTDPTKVTFTVVVDQAKVTTAVLAGKAFNLATIATPTSEVDLVANPFAANTTGIVVYNYTN